MEGSYDVRDYLKNHPLGFETQTLKYLERKKQKVSVNQFRDIRCNISKAIVAWNQKNVKTIGYAELDDFLYGLPVSEKTRANAKSALLGFFKWLKKREQIPIPPFPECDFELGWRNIIDLELQQEIIAEVKRISYHINPNGGARHSTATALGEHFSRQEIMTAGSLHKTNKGGAALYSG